MSLSRPLGLQIPQELWTCKRPNYENLGIFGYEAFALVSKDDRRKLELRSQKCIFLGYGPEGEFGYRLWDPKNKQVVESLDVVFNESEMHKPVERPIEARRITFLVVSTPLHGSTQHTRATT